MRFLRPLLALVTAGAWIGCALDFSIGPPGDVASTDADVASLDGTSPLDGAVNHYGERVTHDLVALWDFEEGQGALVNDRMGSLEPALDLKIDNTALAAWDKPHALSFRDRTWALSGNAGKKLVATNAKVAAITVEAWIAPALGTNTESARVVVAMAPTTSFGTGGGTTTAGQRAFALGLAVPTRAVTATVDGGVPVDAATFSASMAAGSSELLYGGAPVTALTHVVAVRSMDERLTLYVDAVNVGVLTGAAGPANWPNTYPVILGNLVGGGAGFLGDVHLVAIYRAALTADEVMTNFLAGADPP